MQLILLINTQRILKMALIKADIIESVQQQIGFPMKKSNEVVEQLIETIKSTLASGEDVLIIIIVASLLSTWDGIWNASAWFCLMKGFVGGCPQRSIRD